MPQVGEPASSSRFGVSSVDGESAHEGELSMAIAELVEKARLSSWFSLLIRSSCKKTKNGVVETAGSQQQSNTRFLFPKMENQLFVCHY
jgi:hypothetical protein